MLHYTVEEAKSIIQTKTHDNGYLDEDMMDELGRVLPETRRKIELQFSKLRNKTGHMVNTLASRIYESDARFIFELLQNADDNLFERAKNENTPPFITFKKYPDLIVVECNEDGFTESNINAICSVGESTKATKHGYIGAKGIGFKSVFIAASEVHIQSGAFSFKFLHDKNDTDLGMITPFWVPPKEGQTLEASLTRTSLHIHKKGDPDDLEHLRNIISTQFDDLKETCLLFLKKLRRIKVETYDDKGELEKSKEFRKFNIDEHQVSLETISKDIDGVETVVKKLYHITKHLAAGLPRSVNREAPDTDSETAFNTAEVVLAFPLTESYEPDTTMKQEIFAFLPVRTSDFRFIIHSDFDTNANRQDILSTSRRNIKLRDEIEKAFVSAVLEFCEHPTLCYHWPEFLPSEEDLGPGKGSFWSSMKHGIENLLKETPILKSRRRKDLRLVKDLRRLPNYAQSSGEPIVDDEYKDPFLSPNYPSSAVDHLKSSLGLVKMESNRLLQLVKMELRGDDSNKRPKKTSDEWHSCVAKLLNWIWKYCLHLRTDFQSLRIIPLRDGRWCSFDSGPVYFGTLKGVDIPKPLKMKIVDESATVDHARLMLFRHLGVKTVTPHQVKLSIVEQCQSQTSLQISSLVAYLRFFYKFHDDEDDFKDKMRMIPVMTSTGVLKHPHTDDLFLSDINDPYGPKALLGKDIEDGTYTLNFLHNDYMTQAPKKPSEDHPSWERWLYDFVGIRERIRLASRDGSELDEIFLHVYENYPGKFLGLLKHLWTYEAKHSSPSVKLSLEEEIQDLDVQNLCGQDYMICFYDTWLPLQNLKTKVIQYMEHPDGFPFLKFEELMNDDKMGIEWGFLSSAFSVRRDEDMWFLLDILTYVKMSVDGDISVRQIQMVFDLYVAIEAKLATSDDQQQIEREMIKDSFRIESNIFVPEPNGQIWARPDDCLWFAPPEMSCLSPIRSLYARIIGETQMRRIEPLFQDVLQLRSASIEDLVEELLARQNGAAVIQEIIEIYKYMDGMDLSTENIRDAFEENPLIYIDGNSGSGWYKISDCLWSSETPICGQVTLDDQYEDLMSFFVEKLGVKSLTLEMVYDELAQPEQQKSRTEIRVALLCFSDFIRSELIDLDPAPILEANIYPLKYRNGAVSISTTQTDFAIPDQNYLKDRFQDKITMLDFDLEDILRLQPFFQWAGLQRRYLSNLVQERTSISHESCRPISRPGRELKRKAYPILRIAATFSSPRYQNSPVGLYQELQSINVIETDGIFCELEILQNKTLFKMKETIGSEHFDETSSPPTIYVPRIKKTQDVCFCSVLPRRFARWLMQVESDSEVGEADAITNALTAVFAAGRTSLEEILDRQGIIRIPIADEDSEDDEVDDEDDEVDDEDDEVDAEDEDDQEESDEQETDDDVQDEEEEETAVNSTLDNDSTSSGQETPPVYSPTDHNNLDLPQTTSPPPMPRFVIGELSQTNTPSLSRLPTSPFASPLPENERYLRILNRVVSAARSAAFPSQGAFDMSGLRDALDDGGDGSTISSFDGLDVGPDFRSNSQFERDKKIGAAGELYVFELLSKLELSGWNRENWQSRIRSSVNIHPEYNNIEDWNQRETADLVYNDTQGHFTRLLIDHGHVPENWRSHRPKYLLEVKTTTGPCGTRFFMSDNQYKLMRNAHRDENRQNVYLIVRVFWVTSDKISACIYLNPEQLRLDGRLKFSAKWSVFPGDGARTIE